MYLLKRWPVFKISLLLLFARFHLDVLYPGWETTCCEKCYTDPVYCCYSRSHYLLPNKKSDLVPWGCRISCWLPVKTCSKQELQCCRDAFRAGVSPPVRGSHVESAAYRRHVSAAVIMLFLSLLSSKGKMLSTPSPLFLSLSALSPTSLLPHGLREQLAFWKLFTPPPRPPSPSSLPSYLRFVSTHWLALRFPQKKQSSMGRRLQLSVGAAQKKSLKERGKEGEKKRGGGQIISRLRHNLSRYVCLFRRNENQLGFSQFLLFLSIVLPRCLQSRVLLLPPPLPRCFSPNLCNLIFRRPPSARCCY